MASEYDDQPISRTYQYRKVMKPMLERKRRARINRCLDELKELMVGALEAEGENVNKLEKADVLELTVRHLHKLRRQQALGLTPEADYADRFRAGFTHCAAEVSGFLTTVAGVDVAISTRLFISLGACIRQIEGPVPVNNQGGMSQIVQPVPITPNHPPQSHQIPGTYTPPTSPVSTSSSDHVTSASPNPFPATVQGHYTVIPLPLTSRHEQVGSRPSVVVRKPGH